MLAHGYLDADSITIWTRMNFVIASYYTAEMQLGFFWHQSFCRVSQIERFLSIIHGDSKSDQNIFQADWWHLHRILTPYGCSKLIFINLVEIINFSPLTQIAEPMFRNRAKIQTISFVVCSQSTSCPSVAKKT